MTRIPRGASGKFNPPAQSIPAHTATLRVVRAPEGHTGEVAPGEILGYVTMCLNCWHTQTFMANQYDQAVEWTHTHSCHIPKGRKS